MRTEARAARRVAFYALPGGGWRDYWTLLHPPYTTWHLAYVVLGAVTVTQVDMLRLAATLLAFFLAVGIAAHAMDEWQDRPLRTAIPSGHLLALTVLGLAGALALGALGIVQGSPLLGLFMLAGVAMLLAYNLEWFGGRFHTDVGFALAWGAYPVITAAFAQGGTVPWPALLVGAAAFALSLTQRRLSARARLLRRRVVQLEGQVTLDDGRTLPVDLRWLHSAPDSALQLLAVAVPLLAGGLLAVQAG